MAKLHRDAFARGGFEAQDSHGEKTDGTGGARAIEIQFGEARRPPIDAGICFPAVDDRQEIIAFEAVKPHGLHQRPRQGMARPPLIEQSNFAPPAGEQALLQRGGGIARGNGLDFPAEGVQRAPTSCIYSMPRKMAGRGYGMVSSRVKHATIVTPVRHSQGIRPK